MTLPATGHGASLIRAVATVGGLTLVSRVTGFLRDILIAAHLGAGPLADAFFVAFKLPNFLRRLFAEGAFNAAYVPLFAGTLEADGRAAARAFAERAQAVMLAVLLPLVALAIVFMPYVVRVFAPGFEVAGPRYEATVELARVTFPYLLFIALAALHGGILNSLGRFGAPAAAPILLNLVLIAVLLAPVLLDNRAHMMAWGVFVAGALQLLWLTLAVRRAGMLPGFVRPSLAPEVRVLFRRMGPGAIGAGVAQINLLVDLIFASLLPTGAVSYLYYADRVNQLPLGVVGVAIGTALLPMLSRQLRAGELEAATRTQNRAVEMCLLLTLPAAVALVVLAQPIIQVLFERGAFGAAETVATTGALAAYAVGLPGYVLVKVLAPCFYARGDTVTPVKIAVTALVSNVVLIVLLIGPLAHVGIALATALSNGLNAGLLAVALARRDLFHPDDRLRRRVPRIGAATLAMGLLLWLLQVPLAGLPGVVALVVLIAAGALAFFAAAHLLGATDWTELRGLLRRR